VLCRWSATERGDACQAERHRRLTGHAAHSQGKGRKDRYVPLAPRLLKELREYWKLDQPTDYLFAGRTANVSLSTATVQKACKMAAAQARINKPHVSPHTLRHSYATAMLEAGVDILTISRLLGHSSFVTTMVYLHCRRLHLDRAPSPIDWLPVRQCPSGSIPVSRIPFCPTPARRNRTIRHRHRSHQATCGGSAARTNAQVDPSSRHPARPCVRLHVHVSTQGGASSPECAGQDRAVPYQGLGWTQVSLSKLRLRVAGLQLVSRPPLSAVQWWSPRRLAGQDHGIVAAGRELLPARLHAAQQFSLFRAGQPYEDVRAVDAGGLAGTERTVA
jgi:hypothetical protein